MSVLAGVYVVVLGAGRNSFSACTKRRLEAVRTKGNVKAVFALAE